MKLEESVRYMTLVGRKASWLDARRLNLGPPLVLYFPLRCALAIAERRKRE
jgi:hypothetical protein